MLQGQSYLISVNQQSGKCILWLIRLLIVKDVLDVLSFLKWEFKSEWPREQNIKYCPCSTNVFQIYAHACTLSAESDGSYTVKYAYVAILECIELKSYVSKLFLLIFELCMSEFGFCV